MTGTRQRANIHGRHFLTHTARSNLVLGGLALSIVILDQWTKALIRNTIPLNATVSIAAWLDPYLRLTHIQNAGAAFGLGQGLGRVLIYVSFAAILLIVIYFRRVAERSWLLRIALGLQLGGAIGNLIDRLTRGGVTDFVNPGWFPIFNVADSGITVGTILLCIFALFLDSEAKRPRDAPARGIEQSLGSDASGDPG
jgi:signal peptidase II